MNEESLDKLQAGSVAPDFTLCDQNGVEHTLSSYRGQWIFLCFYAKDSVAGCAREIEVLSHHFEAFQKLGITLFGISADSIENHQRFAKEHHIPFALLSDRDKEVARQYELVENKWLSINNAEIPQISFLVNLAGQIEKIYTHIKPVRHASEVIADFMKIQQEDREPDGL